MTAVKALGELIWSRPVIITYHWLAGIWIALVAIVQTNFLSSMAGIAGLIWFFIAFETLEDCGTYFSRRGAYWKVVGVSLVVVIGSTFVYAPGPPGFSDPYHVVDKGAGDVLYGEGWFMTRFNPLIATVRSFKSVQPVYFSDTGNRVPCDAKTADNRGVQAYVVAELVLPPEGLPAAYSASKNQNVLTRMVHEELCKRFKTEIGRYALDQIPTPFVIASRTADETRGMNALGVRYSGVIHVSELRAYVKQ